MVFHDSMMLLSYVNTKLRDQYRSLDALCEDLQMSRRELVKRLAEIDYEYDQSLNRFV
ncbi:MAG: DUF4250 domain-containing protein [Butyricicoccaceae bacterium]